MFEGLMENMYNVAYIFPSFMECYLFYTVTYLNLWFSGLLCCVVWWLGIGVSEDSAASIVIFNLEDLGNMVI